MDINKLSFHISGSTDEALKSIVELSKSLNELSNSFKDLSKNVRTGATSLRSNISASTSGLGRFTNAFKKFNKTTTNSIGNIGRLARKIGQITILFYTLRNGYRAVTRSIEEAISYTKDLNLFLTALGDKSQEASFFLDKLSDSLLIDKAKATRTMGLFYQVSNALGVTSEKSHILSENLTKLSYDIGSFYNVDIEEAITKLQSGLVGLSKPLRALGVNVSENYLRDMVKRMGIKKSLRDMSETEKVQLRYNAILEQTINAQGQFVKRMDEAGNIVEIVKNQFAVLSRNLGEVFLPIIRKIGPEIIGITVALAQLAKAWASQFGPPTINKGGGIVSQVGDLSDIVEDIQDSSSKFASNMNNALRTTRAMKSTLTGIDELNVLNEESESGFLGAIFDFKKADKPEIAVDIIMPDYDNLMDQAMNKYDDVIEKWKTKFIELNATIEKIFEPFNKALSDLGKQFMDLGLFSDDEDQSKLVTFLEIVSFLLTTIVRTISKLITGAQWLWNNALKPMLEFVAPDWVKVFEEGTLAEKLEKLVEPLSTIATALGTIGAGVAVLNFFNTLAKFALSPLGAWGIVATGIVLGYTGFPFSKEFVPYNFSSKSVDTKEAKTRDSLGKEEIIDLNKLSHKELVNLFENRRVEVKDEEGEWQKASYIVSENSELLEEIGNQLGIGVASMFASGLLTIATGGTLGGLTIGGAVYGGMQTASGLINLADYITSGGEKGIISSGDIEISDANSVEVQVSGRGPILLGGDVDAVSSAGISLEGDASVDSYFATIDATELDAIIQKANIVVLNDGTKEDKGTSENTQKWLDKHSKGGFSGFFASGGKPAKGSLFIAGEAGPELVGNFNGQTEVINEQQMKGLGIPMFAGGTLGPVSSHLVAPLIDISSVDKINANLERLSVEIDKNTSVLKVKDSIGVGVDIPQQDFVKGVVTVADAIGKPLLNGALTLFNIVDEYTFGWLEKGKEMWDTLASVGKKYWDKFAETGLGKSMIGLTKMLAKGVNQSYLTASKGSGRDILSERPEGGGVTDQQKDVAKDILMGMMGGWGIIIDLMDDINDGVVGSFLDNIPQLVKAGVEMLLGLVQGVAKALPILLKKIPDIILDVVDIITSPDTMMQFIQAVVSIITTLVEELPNIVSALFQAVPKIISNVIDMILSDPMQFIKMGWNLGVSILEGLANVVVEGLNFIISIAEAPVRWLGIKFPRVPRADLSFLKMADGGFVPQGQMFIAREAGPELVGTMGSSTAVMNNEQIVESVARGVYEAVSQAFAEQSRKETVVNLDGRRVSTRMDRVQNKKGLAFGTGGY